MKLAGLTSGKGAFPANGTRTRAIAGMSLGTGALLLMGGTVVIVGFLTLFAGAVTAVQGYNSLSDVIGGLEVDVREKGA